MHKGIKVQLKDAAPCYGSYSSISSRNTPLAKREKKRKVTHSFFTLLATFNLMGEG